MRIIGGIYKRRRFDVPKNFKARPTTDFAKENLFNVLSNYLDFEAGIQALDLFAGTGSISAELISRGCEKVVSVEKDFQHYAFILKVKQELQVENWYPIKGDVFKYIEKSQEKFDFIFADPPYALEGLSEIPQKILDGNLLNANGLFVLEHGKDNDFVNQPYFLEKRTYGSVNFSIFSK